MCPTSSKLWPNRAFKRSNDAERLSEFKTSNRVLKYNVGVRLRAFEIRAPQRPLLRNTLLDLHTRKIDGERVHRLGSPAIPRGITATST